MKIDNARFEPYFQKLGLEGTAQGMHTAFESLSSKINEDKKAAFRSFTEENWSATSDELYDEAVRLFQDKNMRGLMLNNLVAYGYEKLLHTHGVIKELKVTRDRRDIDVCFRLPRGLLYVSATTVPQERKKTDWAAEIDVLKHYHSRQKKAEQYLFIGLMANGTSKPHSYERSKKTIETLKGWLGNGGFELVSLDCVDEHVRTLSKVIEILG